MGHSISEIAETFDNTQSLVSHVYQELLLTVDSIVANHKSLMIVTRDVWLELSAATDK